MTTNPFKPLPNSSLHAPIVLFMPYWHAQKPQGKSHDMLTQMALDIHNEYTILVMNQIR
jgi:hypothetical protein